VDVEREARALASDLAAGNPHASVHLARLIEADTGHALQPFAQALAAQVLDLLALWRRRRRQGIADLGTAVDDGMYKALRLAAADWDGFPCSEPDGETQAPPRARVSPRAAKRVR
jgi:hypothetical protein